MEIFDLLTRHSSMPLAASNDLKLPEHVLIKGIVDVQLHPVQSGDTLSEVLREISKQLYGVRLFHFSDHFRNHGVRPSSLFGIERGTHGLAPIGETFGKKTQIE